MKATGLKELSLTELAATVGGQDSYGIDFPLPPFGGITYETDSAEQAASAAVIAGTTYGALSGGSLGGRLPIVGARVLGGLAGGTLGYLEGSAAANEFLRSRK